jgi:hypothetical protein
MTKLTIDVVTWKPLRSGTLVGFCTVKIRELRWIIRDLTVHARGDKHWCALPGKAQLDKQGQALRDEHGKIRYVPVIEIDDTTFRRAFSDRVIEALQRYDSRVFDGAAA